MLVDTSIWIDAFADRDSPGKAALERAMSEDEILVGDLILVEVLQGLRQDPKLRLVTAALSSFRVVSLCGAEIAPKAAANYRALRRAGTTIRGTIDVILATWCIENKVALLHGDRDFDPIERELGLVVWR